MPNPDFTVVTPSHRQNEWLRLCTRSVADQGYPQVQHIIQDTGDAAGIQDELNANPHVQLVLEKDNGMYDALNRGFGKATGRIFSWLNNDEQYLPGTLQTIARFFDEHPNVDVVVGDALVIDRDGRPLCYRKAILPPSSLIPSITLSFLSCATFFRRSTWDAGIRFRDDYRMMADSIIFREMMIRGFKWARLHKFVSVFGFLGDNLGASGKIHDEFARWRKELRISLPGPRRLAGRLLVNMKRAMEGATKPLPVDYSIYTLEHPDVRQTFSAKALPGKWSTTPAG